MKKYFILFLVALLGFVACEKERTSSPIETEKKLSKVDVREITDEPVLDQGVLWFSDADAVDDYYNFLDGLNEAATGTEGEKDVLALNEEKFLGFVSLRSTFEDAESQEDPFDKDEGNCEIEDELIFCQ